MVVEVMIHVLRMTLYKCKYNNGLIAKQMLMWRKEERRELDSCKQQTGHRSLCGGGPRHRVNVWRIRKENMGSNLGKSNNEKILIDK